MVASRRNAKRLWDANGKNKPGGNRYNLLTNATINELRRELRLVDDTIAALGKLARLRQPRRRSRPRI